MQIDKIKNTNLSSTFCLINMYYNFKKNIFNE